LICRAPEALCAKVTELEDAWATSPSFSSLDSAALAYPEIGLQFPDFCLIAQRLQRALGNKGLLPDLALFSWARPDGQRLARLLAVVDRYKAIGTGLP
jgi:hypothetical protein